MFLKEYDYREKDNMLAVYFKSDDKHRRYDVIMTINVSTRSFSLRVLNSLVSDLMIVDLVKSTLFLLDEPYWKHYVRIVDVHNKSESYGSLF